MANDQEWRLRVDLDESADLEALLSLLRDPDVGGDDAAPPDDDAVLTHDGSSLSAYAMTEQTLEDTRKRIDAILRREGQAAEMQLSRWDPSAFRWRSTDPASFAREQEREHEQANVEQEQRLGRVVTRTVVCSIGRLIRNSFERQIVAFAQEDGLHCQTVEHPHLFSTQVAFEVTGPPERVELFVRYLKEEARSTMRIDPGLIPFGLP